MCSEVGGFNPFEYSFSVYIGVVSFLFQKTHTPCWCLWLLLLVVVVVVIINYKMLFFRLMIGFSRKGHIMQCTILNVNGVCYSIGVGTLITITAQMTQKQPVDFIVWEVLWMKCSHKIVIPRKRFVGMTTCFLIWTDGVHIVTTYAWVILSHSNERKTTNSEA